MKKQISIEAFRSARDWSQAKLAAELGVDQATICRWEKLPEPSKRVQLALEHLASRDRKPRRNKELSG